MIEATNPLIGAFRRETIENAAEALSAVVVLLDDQHGGLRRLLMPVLDALEDVADDADEIAGATEAFCAFVQLLADQHSDLYRLLSPILHALEHVSMASENGAREPTAGDSARLVFGGPGADLQERAEVLA